MAYLGNYVVDYTTETHVARSLESLGHEVTRLQEGHLTPRVVAQVGTEHDLFLWTQTQALAERGGSLRDRREMLDRVKAAGVPTAGLHLDRWWGLSREHFVYQEPFFRVDHLFTADGGHDEEWRRAGITHHWSPPAVYHAEARNASPWRRLKLDVVFVGSWQRYGHEEWWPYRQELLRKLRRRYGGRFSMWPKYGAVRGMRLNSLYAAARVVVGDSCLTGGARRYWSDRVPETLGRGGFIVHPHVEGLDEEYRSLVPTWRLGEWNALFELVDHYLANEEERERVRQQAAELVRTRHTYRDRMRDVLEVVT